MMIYVTKAANDGVHWTMIEAVLPQDFTKAYLGWESYQQDDGREAWIDDVALGTSPIACPAPTP
jgi:SH3-like domain-containing protein